MRNIFLCCGLLAGAALGWSQGPSFAGAGFSNPFPIAVAPGQLFTMFVQPGAGYNPSAPLPAVSAVYWNGSGDEAMPVLQVSPNSASCSGSSNTTCANLLAVTVQIPFDVPFLSSLLLNVALVPNSVAVSVNGVKTSYFGVQSSENQVHILTVCDVIVGGSSAFPRVAGLPCAPMITHADGQQVSAIVPAVAGEELVAYATGLGQTNPPLTTGQPAAQSSPTVATFNLDFNYRLNALGTAPGAAGAPVTAPLFTGATKGFIGLYQINFIVPPPPPGSQPCVNFAVPAATTGGTLVRSNLTVSIGSDTSFDGAGICVMPAGD